MSLDIPNFSDAGYPVQAFPNATDWDALQRGFTGNGVTSGLVVSAHAPTHDMSVDVSAGEVWINGSTYTLGATTLTIGAAGSTPRRDLVVVSASGAAVIQGAGVAPDSQDPTIVPTMPGLPADVVLLAVVDVPALTLVIQDANVVDKRVSALGDAIISDIRDWSYYRRLASSRLYPAGIHGPVTTGSTIGTANTLYAYPYIETRGGVLSAIGIGSQTAGSANFRLGIYQATSATNLYPNNLVIDAGVVQPNDNFLFFSVPLSLRLSPNTLYWFVLVFDAAGGTTIPSFDHSGYNLLLGDSATDFIGTGGFPNGLSVAFTYGSLPATFPGSAAIFTSAGHIIAARYSS